MEPVTEMKSSPSAILYKRIRKRLRKQRSFMEVFLRDIDVPNWYRGLSVFQLKAADQLAYSLRDDSEQKTIYRTRNCLVGIGLSPIVDDKTIKLMMRLSRYNDIAFLWFLMEQHYNVPGSTSYSANEQLIMSTIAHLDMVTTLKELDRLLPPAQLPKGVQRPKRKKPVVHREMQLYRSSVHRQSLWRTVWKVPKTLPYFEKLPMPKYYSTPSIIRRPEYAVKFDNWIYSVYKDPTHVVYNESNRWYADYKLSLSSRLAHRIVYNEVERVIRNFDALSLNVDMVDALCQHHHAIAAVEKSVEAQLQVLAKENCLNYFDLLVDPKDKVRQRVTCQLEKDVRMYLQQFKVQAERVRKASMVRLLSRQNIHEVTLSSGRIQEEPEVDCCRWDEKLEQARKRLIYKDQLASKQKVECGVNTDIEFTRYMKYADDDWPHNSNRSCPCPIKRRGEPHRLDKDSNRLDKDSNRLDKDSNRLNKDPTRLNKDSNQNRLQGGEEVAQQSCLCADSGYTSQPSVPKEDQFFDYYRHEDYDPCRHGDCICSVGREGVEKRLCGGAREWFPKSIGADPIWKSKRSRMSVRSSRNSVKRIHSQSSSIRHFHKSPHSERFSLHESKRREEDDCEEQYFRCPDNHLPYSFDYHNIFHFKDCSSSTMNIRKRFIETLDSEVSFLNRVQDSSGLLRKLVSKDADRIWEEEVHDRNFALEEQKAQQLFLATNPLGFNDSYYDPDDTELMRTMLKTALWHMRQNPKFVFASLPDAHKLPMLVVWIAYRFGKRYTLRERAADFTGSLQVMQVMNAHILDIPLPRADSITVKCQMSYAKRKFIMKMMKKIRRRYNANLNKSLMRHTRIFWFAMRPFMCGTQSENTFFAYMPWCVSQILRFRAWKPYEHRSDFAGWIRRRSKDLNTDSHGNFGETLVPAVFYDY